jgi:hypothetical protein
LGTIPRSGGYKTLQLAAEYVSKAYFGVHTRDTGNKKDYVFIEKISLW